MGDRGTEVVTYLPASLLRALAARPSATLPWCHEVDGTMVMADLSGFTALSERLAKLGDEGAERLTAVINSFFEKMLKTASRYGGDTLTFGGDAILLLFDGEEHAARAVAASLEMLKQVDRSAAVEGGDGKVKIGMSVGAHSDTFVLGAAGLADERAHLFVLGRGAEPTALAESQAERGELAVSAACRGLLPGWLHARADRRLLAGRGAWGPRLAAPGLRAPADLRRSSCGSSARSCPPTRERPRERGREDPAHARAPSDRHRLRQHPRPQRDRRRGRRRRRRRAAAGLLGHAHEACGEASGLRGQQRHRHARAPSSSSPSGRPWPTSTPPPTRLASPLT